MLTFVSPEFIEKQETGVEVRHLRLLVNVLRPAFRTPPRRTRCRPGRGVNGCLFLTRERGWGVRKTAKDLLCKPGSSC